MHFKSLFAISTLSLLAACAAESDDPSVAESAPSDTGPATLALSFDRSCSQEQATMARNANAGVEWMTNYHLTHWNDASETDLRSDWFSWLEDSAVDVKGPLTSIHDLAVKADTTFYCDGTTKGDCTTPNVVAYVTVADVRAKQHNVHLCDHFFRLSHDKYDNGKDDNGNPKPNNAMSRVGALAHEYSHFFSDITDNKGFQKTGVYGIKDCHWLREADPTMATNNGDNWRLYIMSVLFDANMNPEPLHL